MPRCCSAIVLATLLAGCHGIGRDLSPIRLEPIVTLGATNGEGAIATTPVVSAHHPGGFWVVTPAASAIGTLPLVFGDDGSYLGKLRGDTTEAGTFSGPIFTRLGPGDSIWVFDNSGRVLVFGPQRNYVRSVILPDAPTTARVLPDNRMLASYAGDSVVKLIDSKGTFVRDIRPAYLPPDIVRVPFQVLRFDNGTFFTWQRPDLPIEQWDTTGRRLRTIDRFKAEAKSPRLDSAAPQRAATHVPRDVNGPAWIDAEGRLWFVGLTADRDWIKGVVNPDSAWGRGFAVTDMDKYFDTTIEVRDLESGRVIGSTRLDNAFTVVEPGVLAHVTRTSAGWQRAELSRIIFTEPASRP